MSTDSLPPLSTRVVVVMHMREAKHVRSDGAWLSRVLPECRLHVYGERDKPADLSYLHEEGRRVVVLFPQEGAPALTRQLLARDPRPVTLVVPDGTWRQARRATMRVPGLREAEVVRLLDDDLETVEATARALAMLEGESVAAELRKRRAESEPRARDREPTDASGRESKPATELLEILHQDEFLVAVNKPSGMLVHRGWGNDERPALQILRDQIGKRVHAVHRLDRATSGVLLFATSPEVTRDMQAVFESGAVDKRYLAVCRGNKLRATRLDHPLKSEDDDSKLPAITNFRLLGTFERYGLVEAHPETGRTHQIRKHLKHLSHPIIGDVRYGKGEHNRAFRERFGLHRLALHCESLSFVHPRSGKSLTIAAPFPEDFRRVVDLFESGGAVAPISRRAPP